MVTPLAVPFEAVRADDFLLNVGYFLPWGVVCYLFLASPRTRFHTLVILAASVGGIVSLAIELSQIFFTRHPSVFDLAANILGSVIGALLCRLSPFDVRHTAGRFWVWVQRSRVVCLIVIFFGAVPLLVSVINTPWFDFHNWNAGYPLQLANEASLDRPWLGTIYLAAVYNRALGPEEIAGYYQQGVSSETLRRRDGKGLIALYTFAEEGGGRVPDVSGYGTPLNLKLSPVSHFRWLESGNGIKIIKPAIIKTDGAAKKLYDALSVSNELTIEVWMMPADIMQNGPARIISFSQDTLTRNFTLGQDGAGIDFRLRTPISGPNGTAVNLRTRGLTLSPRKTHLVVTYKKGIETLYVDGHRHLAVVDLKKANTLISFGAPKHIISRLAYVFFYFFPVSYFVSLFLSQKLKNPMASLPIAAGVAIALMTLAELYQADNFGRSVDWALIFYGSVVAVVGVLCGTWFSLMGP